MKIEESNKLIGIAIQFCFFLQITFNIQHKIQFISKRSMLLSIHW